MGTRLIYESSNRNVCTLNDEFELINQGHETTVIVTVENKNRNENQFGAQKVIKKIFNYIPILHARDSYILFLNVACFQNEGQSIIETNIQSNDVSIVKSENTDIFEKSIFVSNILFNIFYKIDKKKIN